MDLQFWVLSRTRVLSEWLRLEREEGPGVGGIRQEQDVPGRGGDPREH